MPLGPEGCSFIRSELIQRVCFAIDQVLADPQAAAKNAVGNPQDFFQGFVYGGFLSDPEKEHLRDLYLAAGWGAVEIVNSHEVNEKPGLFMIKLFKNADSVHRNTRRTM